MLRHIDRLLTGDILKTLDDLGHSDRVLVADANFPWKKYGVPTHRIGTSTVPAMRAILHVFPLENVDGDAVIVRTEHDGDELNDLQLEVRGLARAERGDAIDFARPPRQGFREALVKTMAIILLTDIEPSCYLLRKGVI